jgi:hypothetical protein
MFLVVDLVPGMLSCKFHAGYHGDVLVLISCYCIFVLALAPDRSQVIALRRSYCDDYSRSCFYCSDYKSIILVCCFPLLLLFQAGHR